MFILFGWGKRTIKELGSTEKHRCGHCGNIREWTYKKYTTWFTLFFIPVIPYKSVYVKECPICHGALIIGKEDINSGEEIRTHENKPSDGLTDVQRNYLREMNEMKEGSE